MTNRSRWPPNCPAPIPMASSACRSMPTPLSMARVWCPCGRSATGRGGAAAARPGRHPGAGRSDAAEQPGPPAARQRDAAANLALLGARDGKVYFDEYHHGLQSSGGFWGYLGYHRQHLTLLPIALAVAAALWRGMVRLGPAVPAAARNTGRRRRLCLGPGPPLRTDRRRTGSWPERCFAASWSR